MPEQIDVHQEIAQQKLTYGEQREQKSKRADEEGFQKFEQLFEQVELKAEDNQLGWLGELTRLKGNI